MVCDEVDLRDKARGPTSAHHLWGLKTIWKTISVFMKLVETKVKVCRVIQAKHGYFEEPKMERICFQFYTFCLLLNFIFVHQQCCSVYKPVFTSISTAIQFYLNYL